MASAMTSTLRAIFSDAASIIKREWWIEWDQPSYPPFDYVIAAVDTAYTTKSENDPSAMTVWGIWKGGDQKLIDGFVVNGSARMVAWFSGLVRHFQSGYLYHYAFAMILGVVGLISWILYTHLGSIK